MPVASASGKTPFGAVAFKLDPSAFKALVAPVAADGDTGVAMPPSQAARVTAQKAENTAGPIRRR